MADYGTANSIGELTVHYTLGREQQCTNAPGALCYGDGFVLITSAGVGSRNIYVVPVSNNQTFATMDFWVDSGGFPGHRLTCIYTGNASTKSGAEFGDSVWIPEQGGASRAGGNSWPPPNSADFGYTTLPNPVPYLTLQNAINYTSLTPLPPAKSLYAGVFKYSGTTQEFFQSHCSIALASSRLERLSLSSYKIILPQAMLPSNSGIIATSNSGDISPNSLVSTKLLNSNQIYLFGQVNGGFNDIEICFSTVP